MSANETSVLVVEDDPQSGALIAANLTRKSYRCVLANSGHAALSKCTRGEFDAVVSDIQMDGMDGIELMLRLRDLQPDVPVVLITGRASIAGAVDATKRGAFHYLQKPFSPIELETVLEQAMVARPPRRHSSSEPVALPRGTEELIGNGVAMRDLRARIELVAATIAPILVTGETGTGKELVVRAIHACSNRRSRPFVTVNAAAIPETLLESELFGHARGAFTGATQAHRGLMVEADGGTLLLDEIGDMPLALQAKLLRVLQTGEVRAIGASRAERVDVRIIAATHQKLPELVKAGRFREDLYYRFNVVQLSVPPLRSRTDDIPVLAEAFLLRARERAPRSPVRSLDDELLERLRTASWPGNVRELESAIGRLVILGMREVLSTEDLALLSDEAPSVDRQPTAPPLSAIDDLVRRHVELVLARTDGNRARAAKILGVNLSTLYRWQHKWQY
jgi:two-component system response regulator HydG